VFGGALLEGEGILILAAILSGVGALDPVRVWLVAAAGAWLGHLFWFAVGRAIRRRRLGPDSPSFKARVAQVKRLIEARPVTAIFLLQYLYGLRLVGAIALGLTDLSLLRFASYQIVTVSSGPPASEEPPIYSASSRAKSSTAGSSGSGWARAQP